MGLRDRIVELTSIEELDEFIEKYPTCALFKAGACHKTMQGFGYVEEALNDREGIHMAFVRVIESRPVSNYIEDITGIEHQSPQFILMVDRKPVYDVDNWDIVPESLDVALTAHFGAVEGGTSMETTDKQGAKHANTGPYKELLHQYVSGMIHEEEFKSQWLGMFQMDATLRSTQEFDLLNSLFGDVDIAIEEKEMFRTSGPLAMASASSSPAGALKTRAEKLLKDLEAHS